MTLWPFLYHFWTGNGSIATNYSVDMFVRAEWMEKSLCVCYRCVLCRLCLWCHDTGYKMETCSSNSPVWREYLLLFHFFLCCFPVISICINLLLFTFCHVMLVMWHVLHYKSFVNQLHNWKYKLSLHPSHMHRHIIIFCTWNALNITS